MTGQCRGGQRAVVQPGLEDQREHHIVGQLRAAMANHVAEPAWRSLVKRVRSESPEFEALWVRHEVQPMRNLTKRFRHPDLGVLTFDYTYPWLGQRSEARMTTHKPADEHTAELLSRL